MKVVVDTSVVISGVFFGGVPGRVLEAWRDELIELVVSMGTMGTTYHNLTFSSSPLENITM